VTITGAFKGVCSNGFPSTISSIGGTPPYRVSSTFPQRHAREFDVNTNGGSFRAITNGTCVDPLVFTIVDATGAKPRRHSTTTRDTERAGAPPIAVSPTSLATAACTGKDVHLSSCRRHAVLFSVVTAGTTRGHAHR
jgi:hypothetical protein